MDIIATYADAVAKGCMIQNGCVGRTRIGNPVGHCCRAKGGSMTISVEGVQVGQVAPLGSKAVPSGYVKRPVVGTVSVSSLGLSGDEQADHSVHGGPEKAVYGYSASHYPAWRAEFPERSELFVAGGMGENLTIAGLDESGLCVGDVHQIGSVTLQVCQPRQPCFKLVAYFGDPRMARAMVRSGRSGWYYRVLEGGELRVGADVVLVHRPQQFSFARLVAIVNGSAATQAEAAALAEMPELASTLRRSVQLG
ncbi:MOSC domain-containing protein [Microvirga sp. SRT01]|uniref:MOSC domain-containing protein n=2 Tax=Sphingomonas longa TaxID=2778730 RepID=A0ABS2DDX3_9SPHN|nr:MOSC domain-containing protein [Microvirga sp. SRT01]MBM6578264.1 MOSC domain-containing protein [Sphingomonas sp. BT552]MBR7711305.1 MOSC domain-containing protein [Microvirga sp. SRT01]